MKSLTKRLATVGITAAYALTLFSGAQLFTGKKVSAETEDYVQTIASTYFYDNLKTTDKDNNEQEYTLAKKFYKAFEEMQKTGDFIDGKVEYSLTAKGLATSEEIKKWVIDGDLTIPKAFSAARDAYLTDHPELFYIDFYKLTISAGRQNGVYSAFIDSGREANAYHDNGFTSAIDVNKALNSFYAEVNKIADEAEKAAKDDKYGMAKDVLKARYVNKYIAENVVYDFGALDDYLETGVSSASAVSTAFGALVNKTAVCGGYSAAYKAVMDKLGIPCLIVSGYSKAKDSKGEFSQGTTAHAWNYIWLENAVTEDEEVDVNAPAAASYAASEEQMQEGAWYAVDVTWNSTGTDRNKYMNMGFATNDKHHITDGYISSSGYELKYPELALYDYGCKTDSNGLVRSIQYTPYAEGTKDEFGFDVMAYDEQISYNGKSAIRLAEEDNLHIIYRTADLRDGEINWTVWIDLAAFYKAYLEEDQIAAFDNGVQTKTTNPPSALYSQFAVIDSDPDLNYNPDYLVNGKPIIPDPAAGIPNMYYSHDYNKGDKDIGDHITVISAVFENKAYGTYSPAPYVSKTNASVTEGNTINDSMRAPNSSLMDEKYVKVYEITYDQPLRVLDPDKEIGITYTTKHSKENIGEYAKFLPLESGKMVELVGEHTLRFRFMPSLMYEHNMETYTFSFTNVGSNQIRYKADGSTYTTGKLPNSIPLTFDRLYRACPAVFGYDGRLWVECCAQPTLLSNSDLSEVDFKDEEGNIISENKRSQMLLVVDSVNKDTQDAMLNEIDKNGDINIKQEDIKKSETYDIDLQICGQYASIPNGSYVKIALGFPQGYGPEDEGVTFKLFHYKHDKQGNYLGVEEIPCVITKLGLVATVSSFSPYMVAAVPADKASDNKTVYASINGRGGKLSKEDGAVKTLKPGENCTYDIKPDSGYMVYSVTLNGKDITNKVTAEGKLELSNSELESSNEIEIKYIAIEAAHRLTEKDTEIIEPVKVAVSVKGEAESIPGTGGEIIITDIPELPVDPDEPEPPVVDPDEPITPPDGNDPNDEANVGGNTDLKPDKDNSVVIAITVISVVVALACVGAAVVVIMKRRN